MFLYPLPCLWISAKCLTQSCQYILVMVTCNKQFFYFHFIINNAGFYFTHYKNRCKEIGSSLSP